MEPGGQKHQLRRDRGNKLPSDSADKRQVEPHVGIGVLEAPETMNGLARLRHMTRIRGIACQLQREIRFASRVQLRRPAGVDGPAAIRELPAPYIVCQL